MDVRRHCVFCLFDKNLHSTFKVPQLNSEIFFYAYCTTCKVKCTELQSAKHLVCVKCTELQTRITSECLHDFEAVLDWSNGQ